MSRIMENLNVKGMGAFVPGPTEDSLENYVDMLALIHKGSDVTSDVIKTFFLKLAMIAAETREKLSMMTDLDEMFDFLAKIQYPHPEYCQPLDVQNSMDTDRQLSVLVISEPSLSDRSGAIFVGLNVTVSREPVRPVA